MTSKVKMLSFQIRFLGVPRVFSRGLALKPPLDSCEACQKFGQLPLLPRGCCLDRRWKPYIQYIGKYWKAILSSSKLIYYIYYGIQYPYYYLNWHPIPILLILETHTIILNTHWGIPGMAKLLVKTCSFLWRSCENLWRSWFRLRVARRQGQPEGRAEGICRHLSPPEYRCAGNLRRTPGIRRDNPKIIQNLRPSNVFLDLQFYIVFYIL